MRDNKRMKEQSEDKEEALNIMIQCSLEDRRRSTSRRRKEESPSRRSPTRRTRSRLPLGNKLCNEKGK